MTTIPIRTQPFLTRGSIMTAQYKKIAESM